MPQEALRTGLGFVEAGIRYGYTDNTLWYLGETRLYFENVDPRDVRVLTYDELKKQVDTWISASPASRSTQPTSDETKVSPGFQGIGIAKHEFYYQNYFIVGKADPIPYPSGADVVQVFSYAPLGITGVGFGYSDGRQNNRAGYTDNFFWYKGEARIFRVAQIPTNAIQIGNPASGPPSASGFKYYQTPDGRTWITGTSGDSYLLLDYNYLKQLVDIWEKGKIPIGTDYGWYECGFLWLGQRYWQGLSYQLIPDSFALALADSERNLPTIVQWLPGTKAIDNKGATQGIAVSLPRLDNLRGSSSGFGGLSFKDLLAARLLADSGKKQKKRKRGRSR